MSGTHSAEHFKALTITIFWLSAQQKSLYKQVRDRLSATLKCLREPLVSFLSYGQYVKESCEVFFLCVSVCVK